MVENVEGLKRSEDGGVEFLEAAADFVRSAVEKGELGDGLGADPLAAAGEARAGPVAARAVSTKAARLLPLRFPPRRMRSEASER